MEPIIKLSLGRAAWEFAGWAGVSAFALTMTTEEVAIIVSLATLLFGAVVWLVRLEGRVNMMAEMLRLVREDVRALSRHHGVSE